MKVYKIYRATNKKDSRSYVGRTSASLASRRSWHYSNAKKKNHKFSPFFDALLRTERSDWEWIILAETTSLKESYELEAKFIKELDAVNNGYNFKDSDLTPWNKGKTMSEEYRENLKGERNPMFGKTHSEEYRKWRSEHMSRIQLGINNHAARKIYCVDLDRYWDTVKECAEELNINADSIVKNCRGVNKTTGGYKFEYADNKEVKRRTGKSGDENPRAKGVRCVDTGEVWGTVKACAEQIGVSPQLISKVCRGVNKTAKGLHFEYTD